MSVPGGAALGNCQLKRVLALRTSLNQCAASDIRIAGWPRSNQLLDTIGSVERSCMPIGRIGSFLRAISQ